MREWDRRVHSMSELLNAVPGVRTERFVPEIANEVPHLRVQWDPARIALTPVRLMQKLREGTPSIELVPGPQAGVEISSWMLQPGEAEIVGKRIRELLTGA
jgi:L-seryl-tRNA(Ser) seleniumtransferase